MTAEHDRQPQIIIEPMLLDIQATSASISLSVRQIERLLSRGAFPRPRRIGRLRRWTPGSLAEWVANGCRNRETTP